MVVVGFADFAHLPLLLVHLLPHNRQLLHACLHGLPAAGSAQHPRAAIHVVLGQDALGPLVAMIWRGQGGPGGGQAGQELSPGSPRPASPPGTAGCQAIESLHAKHLNRVSPFI